MVKDELNLSKPSAEFQYRLSPKLQKIWYREKPEVGTAYYKLADSGWDDAPPLVKQREPRTFFRTIQTVFHKRK